jgi:histidine triad (HIT) family protein
MADVEECIFCKIARGKLPAYILHKDERVVAFHDIDPQAPVHILVVPCNHIPNLEGIEEADRDIVAEMFRVAHKVATDLRFGANGYRLVMNNGRPAGQIVPHLHLHVLSGRRFGWPPG